VRAHETETERRTSAWSRDFTLIRFQPLALAEFPTPRADKQRKASQFKAPWNRTLELLERELEQLAAKDVTIRAGFAAANLRVDGWPRGDARPAHPAVILTFTDSANNKPMSFPCDRFLTYRENIRAIALSLEALRAVDRFGVTRGHEQYSGFHQIEGATQWTVERAAEYIATKAGASMDAVIRDRAAFVHAYRVCASAMHPDVPGSNAHEWHLLGQARVLLEEHHAQAHA
jgi:hypothetical protein